ncbi:MAG: ABC transporter ATP-binding protein [Acholeplasmatales bacterium]|nr:ABC transporter ATP-binding protein [Acholeplasmatales bacterium]
MDLKCEDIKYSIEKKDILNGVSLEVKNSEFHTILGPNGCGKTTLLKNIYRVIKPTSGIIYLDMKNLKEIKLKESAKSMAVVSQFNELNFTLSAREIVLLGRNPHLRVMESEHKEDYEIVDNALKIVGLYDKKDQPYQVMSGGEKQRVVLARAIAQQPKLLLLDEPTNHLDIKYQLEILKIIKDMKINVLAVLHDIQLACKYSDYIYLMKDGNIVYQGHPNEIITKENIKDIYDVDCEVLKDNNSILVKYI